MASFERDRIMRFGWNALRYAIGPVGGLLIPWLVIRGNSVALWGEMQTPLIWLQLIVHITTWGNKDFLLRAFARDPSRGAALLKESLPTRGMLLLFSMLAIGVDGRSALVPVIPAALLMFFSSSLEPIIVWHKRFAPATAAELMGLGGQVIYLVFKRSLDADSVFWSIYVNQSIRCVLLVTLNWSLIPWGLKWPNFRIHIFSALPFFLAGFSGLLASRIDLYMANALLDRATVGQYQVVTSLFLQFQSLAALITTPMTRDLYRLQAGSVSLYTQRLRTWALIGLMPLTAIAWAALTFLFHFETRWILYLGGAMLVWPVFAYVPMINQLYKHGRERSVMWANFAAAGLSAGLTFLLLPRLGIAGGLFAAASGQWLMLAWIRREENRLHHALPGM